MSRREQGIGTSAHVTGNEVKPPQDGVMPNFAESAAADRIVDAMARHLAARHVRAMRGIRDPPGE